jgi:hypothetical protein
MPWCDIQGIVRTWRPGTWIIQLLLADGLPVTLQAAMVWGGRAMRQFQQIVRWLAHRARREPRRRAGAASVLRLGSGEHLGPRPSGILLVPARPR